MNRITTTISTVLIIAALAGCSLGGAGAPAAKAVAPSTTSEYRRFTPATEAELLAEAEAGRVSPRHVIVKTVGDFDTSVFTSLGFSRAGGYEMGGFRYFRLEARDSTVRRLSSLTRVKGVIYAEHELVSSIPEVRFPASTEGPDPVAPRGAAEIKAVLDDPMTWGRYGHFETTGALGAYTDYGFGPNTVYAAGIDYGINRTHEDFIDSEGKQIVEFAKSAFRSDDGGHTFTFVGDGTPFVDVPESEDWDGYGHGTHTAGIIAALGDNGKGVAGVAWKNVKLISYKCFANDTDGSGSDWAVYTGLKDLVDWKAANGITQTIPVNMSLGGDYAGSYELEMINLALANGIVVIAAMGNDGSEGTKYPASYAGVIAVGATRSNGDRVHFSSMGSHISVMAPGYDIYSTTTGATDAYEDMSGTSMAAPFVTGLVAYMLTFNPTLTLDQIKALLEQTADDLDAPGWDSRTGYGQVNVREAVRRVRDGDVPAPGSVYCTKKVTVSVRNLFEHFDSGIEGHEDAVPGQAVYLYGSDGKFVSLGLTNATDGSVEFRNLKAGSYTVSANFYGDAASEAFTLDNSSDKAVTLTFDKTVLLVQTMYNDATDPDHLSSADTVITVYDEDGNLVAGPYDRGTLDTFVIAGLVRGHSYRLRISPYSYSPGSYGEYGFNVGFAMLPGIDSLVGRGAGADDEFEENDTLADAKNIALGAAYYGLYLGDDDWFEFVMP